METEIALVIRNASLSACMGARPDLLNKPVSHSRPCHELEGKLQALAAVHASTMCTMFCSMSLLQLQAQYRYCCREKSHMTCVLQHVDQQTMGLLLLRFPGRGKIRIWQGVETLEAEALQASHVRNIRRNICWF